MFFMLRILDLRFWSWKPFQLTSVGKLFRGDTSCYSQCNGSTCNTGDVQLYIAASLRLAAVLETLAAAALFKTAHLSNHWIAEYAKCSFSLDFLAVLFIIMCETVNESENFRRVHVDGAFISRLFSWGNKEMPYNEHRMNVWQGDNFPTENLGEDGYIKTCPVRDCLQCNFRHIAAPRCRHV